MKDERSMLDKFGFKPIHVMIIVMLAFGGAGSSAIVARYFGLDVEEVKTEIDTHAKVHDKVLEDKLIARIDSIVGSYIENDLATEALADAIKIDAQQLKVLVDYGFNIMKKDSINEAWKFRVDQKLLLNNH